MTDETPPILRDVPMPILTPRLRIEPVGAGFGAAALEALVESQAEIGRWSAWMHKPDALTLGAREAWQRESEAAFIRRETLFMQAFERDTGRLIAGTGYHNIDWEIPSVEIGYWVRTSATGRGYATEITVGLLRYAFQALNARRVAIQHADGNDASGRVIAKAQVPFEGILRNDHRHVDGRIGDTHMFAATDITQVPELDVHWG